MLYRLYAIACQLSPVEHSSGVEHLETDTFKLHCLQTQTGLYEYLLLKNYSDKNCFPVSRAKVISSCSQWILLRSYQVN